MRLLADYLALLACFLLSKYKLYEGVLQEPGKRSFHFCIVNLVIGTLYCVKGNYEFGIARIIKSMEPESEKLEADTWFYAKRCLLALFEGISKHMVVLKASLVHRCLHLCSQMCICSHDTECQ